LLAQAMIINAVVLFVVLESDLGPHRKVTRFRVIRPLVTACLLVPFFIKGLVTTGTGLILELVLAAAGIALGLVTAALMTVYRSPKTGKAVTRAGFAYGGLWTAVIGARAAFSYGSAHWFGPQLGRWMAHHSVTSSAITDGLIFMAVGMLLTRVIAMGLRAKNLPSTPHLHDELAAIDDPAPGAAAAGRQSSRPLQGLRRREEHVEVRQLSEVVAPRSANDGIAVDQKGRPR
jgi:hypothetical protein